MCVTDNANTSLIHEISGIGGIRIEKRNIKKIILDYIADDFLIFFCTRIITTIGQEYADSQFLGYPI